MNLPLRVVDALYQFDGQKLTFVYMSPDRVDFRALLREMYASYRCRIWLDRVGYGTDAGSDEPANDV